MRGRAGAHPSHAANVHEASLVFRANRERNTPRTQNFEQFFGDSLRRIVLKRVLPVLVGPCVLGPCVKVHFLFKQHPFGPFAVGDDQRRPVLNRHTPAVTQNTSHIARQQYCCALQKLEVLLHVPSVAQGPDATKRFRRTQSSAAISSSGHADDRASPDDGRFIIRSAAIRLRV